MVVRYERKTDIVIYVAAMRGMSSIQAQRGKYFIGRVLLGFWLGPATALTGA